MKPNFVIRLYICWRSTPIIHITKANAVLSNNKLMFHDLMVEQFHFRYLPENRLMQKVCVEFVSNINTVEDRSIYRDKYRESLIPIYGY